MSHGGKALRKLDSPARVCPECQQASAYEWRRAWVHEGKLRVELGWTCERKGCKHDFDPRAYSVDVEQDKHAVAWPEDRP